MESLEEKRRKRWEEFAKLSGGKNAKTSLKFEVRVAYDVSSVVRIFFKEFIPHSSVQSFTLHI